MKVTFKGYPHISVFRGAAPGTEGPWEQGTTRELDRAVGDALLEAHPDAFEVVGGSPKTASKDRAVKSPKARAKK